MITGVTTVPSLSVTHSSFNNVGINNHLNAHNASFENVTIMNEWVQEHKYYELQ